MDAYISIYVHIYTHICIYICIYLYIYICIHICICVYIYIHVYIHVFSHVESWYVYAHISKHTHTYSHAPTISQIGGNLSEAVHRNKLCNGFLSTIIIVQSASIAICWGRSCALPFFQEAQTNLNQSRPQPSTAREVGGWGRDPKKCTESIWGMGSSTI